MPTARGRSLPSWPVNRRHERYSPRRFSRYARELEAAINAMRFRITEPTFFLHKDREVGEVMEAKVGPYRNIATGGGLQRIPQFVEMPDEIKEVIQSAAQSADIGQPSNQGQSPQTAPVRMAPKANPIAARVRALATRRAKFQDLATSLLDSGETTMTRIETDAPGILTRANQAAEDEIAAITDLDTAMKQFAAGNGEPS